MADLPSAGTLHDAGLLLLVSASLAAGVSALAWRAGALTRDGAVAATAVGALVFGAGGLPWAALLLTFFVSGSVMTRLRRRKQGMRSGGARDAFQVLANGGVAAVSALARLLFGASWVWDALVAGSLAAMTADTWATEVGIMTGARPRLLVGMRPVEPGTSGGVSGPGTLAGVAGAAVMAAAARAVLGPGAVAAGALRGAVVGLFLDSLLGATLQARYRCESCGTYVEVPRRHRSRCPGPIVHEGGLAWLDNDGVNAAAGLAGGLVAALTAGLIGTVG